MIHRKERIVFTAIDVMNELGVQAISTKKIAKYEKISESTVFKHFGNKNTLLLAVLDYYARYDADIFESIKMKNLSGKEGIQYYVEAFLTYFENYPAITAITQGLDEMRYNESLEERVIGIIELRAACMLDLVQSIPQGESTHLRIEARGIVDIIMGTIDGIIRRWRLENYGFPLKDHCRQAVDWIIEQV